MTTRWFKQIFIDKDGHRGTVPAIAPFSDLEMTADEGAELQRAIDKGSVVEVAAPLVMKAAQPLVVKP